MLHQINPSEKVINEINRLFKELKINQLLRAANIRKSRGVSVQQIFEFIFLLALFGKNQYRFLESKRGQGLPKKDVYYNFLNNPHYAWRRFLLMLASKVTDKFDHLTSDKRVRAFIIDDSPIARNRSKKAELLAKVFDHSKHRFIKGFNMLTLGWTEGYSFIPVDFAMLSSAKETNRYNGVSASIDKRSHGFKRRLEAMMPKPDVVLKLIKNALNIGITADYVLMDTWFTNEPMIKDLGAIGLHVIGMVKNNHRYRYNGQLMKLDEIRKCLYSENKSDIIGSLLCETKSGISVKLVFIRHHNNRNKWLVIASTDLSLDDKEIIRIYGMRWEIEVFFKSSKSLLKLGTEYQGRSYDMLIAHTTIVFSRYILLEWERRHNQDYRSFGDLFFLCCEEIQDLDYETALRQLMYYCMMLLDNVPKELAKIVSCQVMFWIAAQPLYIQRLFSNFCYES
ncbi:transposase [Thermosyntropha sp.]|uniref:IS4 family transposase n=1 Tax=Thermosyntropha sp. TaxID=2740820 RepID=UPI0026003A94|nr:transposase [Thermosyntropha sp.]MBO8158454.1 transposase [Thermosyntropha sp.]